MRNFKKFLTLVLAVMMVVSSFAFSTSAATKFTDVPADDAYLAEAVDLLNYVGIAKGVSETEFGTEQAVTRQQFALFVYRLLKGGKDAPKSGNNTTRFEDLKDPTYFYAISWANSQGIVNGRDAKTFDPEGSITLQEAYAMLVRALGYEADGTVLAYPYQHIEIAEQKDVELDEGLDSSINYEDALTRGDMAILLYNAFFAATGEAEIVNRTEVLTWDDGNESTAVLVQEEVYPTLAEKAFDVVKVAYDVVATPHYAMAGQDVTDDLGYPAVLLDRTDCEDFDWETGEEPPMLTYLAAEDLGLETAEDLDENFMAEYTLYVTLKDSTTTNSKEVDTVLFADSALTRKTVNDLKFDRVTTNKGASYFDGTDSKVLSGKVTSGTDVMYFYDAPYSYANPTYGTGISDPVKYVLRNKENPEFISFTLTDADEGYYEATISDIIDLEATPDVDGNGKFNDGEQAEFTRNSAVELVEAFEKAYYNGLYEAELIDIDGDGLVDYIDYKEYSFFQVTTDEDEVFEDGVVDYADSEELVPVIATNEAVLVGEKVADEDFVIGYYDDTFEDNVIFVKEIVKPTTAEIKTFKGNNVVLADNTTLDVKSAWKLVANYAALNEETKIAEVVYDIDTKNADNYCSSADLDALINNANIGEKVDFYVYDGVVLFQEGASSAALKYTDNLIVPAVFNGDAVIEQYDAKLGDMVYYVDAFVDGKDKTIALNVEDTYPAFYTKAGGFSEDDFDTYYGGQLCTYSIDADGLYTLESLEWNENEDGDKYLGINGVDNVHDEDAVLELLADDKKDDSIQYIESAIAVAPSKITGTRYRLNSEGANANFPEIVTLKSFSKIIIKNFKYDDVTYAGAAAAEADDELDIEYLTYTADNFGTVEGVITNASVIISNDTASSSRENLVLLYGEAENFDFDGNTTTTDGERIVSDYNIAVDENGYYRNYYTLLDPFTGSKTENVAGTANASKASSLNSIVEPGNIVELNAEGLVKDQRASDIVDELNAGSSLKTVDNLVWIREYNEAEKVLDLVPVDAVSCWQDVDEFDLVGYTGSYENELADYQYNDNSILYSVTNSTKVVMLRSDNVDSGFFKWGAFSALTVADLAKATDSTTSFKSKVYNANKDKYEVGNAKYLKAYVVLDDEGDDQDMPTVSYIVIMAHGYEAETMLDTHTDALHADC